MDEKALEESLELYKSQLLQVEQTLQAAGSVENADLLQLREDLKELVSLTEDGLLSLKKSNILKSLENEPLTTLRMMSMQHFKQQLPPRNVTRKSLLTVNMVNLLCMIMMIIQLS